eukprot:TRINITY_DN1709_c0_g1_i1.p3 TRINITY_DN1709_c0_g1~~TRINITY_DN1709_c0_g1_i1.p3  ORF type:complete len:192 (-),score=46.81 TRINITY_DN1709_c0_g1_i1:60-635(-)
MGQVGSKDPWDNLPETCSSVCRVRPGLYIGSQRGALKRDALKALGVTHVLTMNNWPPPFPEDFVYEVKDTEDEDRGQLLLTLERNLGFIEEGIRAGGVLVHCLRGVNRSGTMLVAYLMHSEGLPLATALQEARKARPVIEPRPNMMEQLAEFEARLQEKRRQQEKEEKEKRRQEAWFLRLPFFRKRVEAAP